MHLRESLRRRHTALRARSERRESRRVLPGQKRKKVKTTNSKKGTRQPQLYRSSQPAAESSEPRHFLSHAAQRDGAGDLRQARRLLALTGQKGKREKRGGKQGPKGRRVKIKPKKRKKKERPPSLVDNDNMASHDFKALLVCLSLHDTATSWSRASCTLLFVVDTG